jgi:flagellar motor protein MotB
MFSRRTIATRRLEEENPFLLSFSDLMAGLLAIFILVLVVTLVELEKRKAELRFTREELIENLESIRDVQADIAGSLDGVVRRENALASMLEEIRNTLRQRGIEVFIAENGTVLRIPEQQLQFGLGEYEIPSAYRDSATAIGKVLLEALQRRENRGLLDTVFVEGHTDSVPNPRAMGNWGLSTYRAISLWEFWTESPGEVAELQNLRTISPESPEEGKPLISVSGYADTRSTHGPLVVSLEKNRPEDRRIDIRFTLASREKQNLTDIKENFQKIQDKTNQLIESLQGGS